jgi:hypothetical protein
MVFEKNKKMSSANSWAQTIKPNSWAQTRLGLDSLYDCQLYCFLITWKVLGPDLGTTLYLGPELYK